MREIKFRVYGKENDVMYSWKELLELDSFKDHMIMGGNEDRYYSPLMQFTGLHDRNGKEIYEGDVLKRTIHLHMYGHGSLGDCDDIVQVEYREDYAGFYVGERPLFSEIDATKDFYTQCRCTKFEVIGNRFEYGELLDSQ